MEYDMSNDKSVLIPIPLVKQVVELLGYWDISKYDLVIRDGYREVLLSLNIKMQKIECRAAYAKIIKANDESSRHDARIEYLWHKNRLNDLMTDGCVF
jgi:hypothetical protein